MKVPATGTAEWFQAARWRCIDHLRALLSVRSALDCMNVVLRDWSTAPVATKSALHAASVIAYARPFTVAFTKHGKVKYSIKSLKRVNGFDVELHTHIMDLRDRLIAHSDYDLFPSTTYVQTIGDERLPVELGFNVKGLIGIEDPALAGRYRQHFVVCADNIEIFLNHDAAELVEQSRLHPSAFNAEQDIPEVVGQLKPDGSIFPRPLGPAGEVTNPKFPEGLSKYSYIMLTHAVQLIETGTYKIHNAGVPTEITFTVDKKTNQAD